MMLTNLHEFVAAALRSVEKLDYSWVFKFEEPLVIMTESPWRLVTPEKLIVAADDHAQWFGLPQPVDASECVLSRLASLVVKSVSVDDLTGDLFLYFSDKIYLQFLQVSAGYESCRAYTGLGQTICTGGGGLVFIAASENP